jgi:hypothetical protein
MMMATKLFHFLRVEGFGNLVCVKSRRFMSKENQYVPCIMPDVESEWYKRTRKVDQVNNNSTHNNSL